jgi:hypothetical protein
VLLLGIVLSANFLVHLSYFVAVLVLLSVTFSLVISKMGGRWLFWDLLKALILSQVFTAPWWLPKNLYWWWIKALVTSSGLYSAGWQVGDFGVVAVFFAIVSLAYIAFTRGKWNYLLLFWTLPLFIESQNEAVLFAINRVDLTWTTLAKPLEGFRFFPYLAQPAAISIGAVFSKISKKPIFQNMDPTKLKGLLIFFVGVWFFWGITGPYMMDVKFQTSGLIVPEYEAALWFKENTGSDSRIVADYYRAQMFSGVTGGKALDGGMFPLRNLDLPYIGVPAVVQDDIYIIYNTTNPAKAHELAKKYGATHIFYSANMAKYGNLLSNYRPASQYGVPINLEKFSDPDYFKIAYSNERAEVAIFRVV